MKHLIWITLLTWNVLAMAATKTLELSRHQKLLKSSANYRALGEIIHRDYLKNGLRQFLKESRPNRVSGSAGHAQARAFILSEFKRLGARAMPALEAKVEEFKPDVDWASAKYMADFQREVGGRFSPLDPVYVKWKRFSDDVVARLGQVRAIPGHNIVFEIPGKKNPEDVLVIAANYDTIVQSKDFKLSFDGAMPGANDNGTGVIGVLALAEILAQLELDRTVLFVIFDYQELASMGAREFVARYQGRLKSARSGMINLLMLGHDSERDDKNKKKGNMKVYSRSGVSEGGKADQQLLAHFQAANKSGPQMHLFTAMDNGTELSDQAAFWSAGVPALLFTQDWENDPDGRQHSVNDFPETLNFDTYTRCLRYLLAGILQWSQSPL